MSEITERPRPEIPPRRPVDYAQPHHRDAAAETGLAAIEETLARKRTNAETITRMTLAQQVAALLLRMPLAEALEMASEVTKLGPPVDVANDELIFGYSRQTFEHAARLNKWAQETVKGIPTP